MKNKLIKMGTIIVMFNLILSGTATPQNIITNSSFEKGVVGGLPVGWSYEKGGGAEGTVAITDKDAHSGKQCLFIENKNGKGYIHPDFPNYEFTIKPGKYIYRLWAKSDSDISFIIQIYDVRGWKKPNFPRSSLQFDNGLFTRKAYLQAGRWIKYEFPVEVTEEFPASIQIGISREKGRLWLDDVELIKGKPEEEKILQLEDAQKAGPVLWDTITSDIDLKLKNNWKKVENISYFFKGNPAIENDYITAIFYTKKGRVILYSKSNSGKIQDRIELLPFKREENKPLKITLYKILENTKNNIVLEAYFSSKDGEISTIFSFSKNRIIEVNPGKNMKGISIPAQIEFGIIPSIIGDSLIYNPQKYSLPTLYIPSENIFLGLLKGENSMLVATWPEGEQKISLIRSKNKENTHIFKSFNIQLDGKSVYLAILSAPGIWHREKLNSSYLEKDVVIGWKKPFFAPWRVQIYVDGIATDLYIKGKRSRYWGGIVRGWWDFPVWFEGKKTHFYFTKKIPPIGDAIIYFFDFFEGTRSTYIETPVDIMRESLGEDFTNTILDFEGRKRRPRGKVKIHAGATCYMRDRMKEIFEAGREVVEKDVIKAYTEDIQSFFAWEKERADEYLKFSKEMQEFCHKNIEEKPELTPFLNEIEKVVKEIEIVYSKVPDDVTAENLAKIMKEINALTKEHRPENFSTFLSLSHFTRISGGYDGVNREFSRIVEKLLEKAGKLCVNSPEAVKIAEEIRKRARRILRHGVSFEREFTQ